jgi:hypothetical protein
LGSSSLRDVYIWEAIRDELGYKNYPSEFWETTTFTSGKERIDRLLMAVGLEGEPLFSLVRVSGKSISIFISRTITSGFLSLASSLLVDASAK